MMKSVIHYTTAIFLATVFLSFYSYLADIIVDRSLAVHHPEHLLSYLVYFILYKTWLLGLTLLCYVLIFYKATAMEGLIRKIAFIVVLSGCLSAVFFKSDFYFADRPSVIRSIIIYFLTGLSLLWIHLRYWCTGSVVNKMP